MVRFVLKEKPTLTVIWTQNLDMAKKWLWHDQKKTIVLTEIVAQRAES